MDTTLASFSLDQYVAEGIVPQDSLLFDGSVRDSIALTAPDAGKGEAAAGVACAHDFIMELPQGYASTVSERGGGLSGGQRQYCYRSCSTATPNLLIWMRQLVLLTISRSDKFPQFEDL